MERHGHDMENAASRMKKQTVVFVRHGVAKHNLVDPRTHKAPDLKDPDLFDPPLVRDGKHQAVDVGERLYAWWDQMRPGEPLELVMTSPLTRCLQTATLAFLRGDRYSKGLPEPTIVCIDNLREAYGMHYPDRRRRKSLLKVCSKLFLAKGLLDVGLII